MKLIQLRCANCHSTLSRTNSFETRIKCPYCGTVNEVTGTMSQNVAAPERVILFQTVEDDFDRAVCEFFVDQDYTVNDIFEKVHMENATPIYLPMYLFEGKYEATYSCQVGYKETQVSTNLAGNKLQEKTVTKWHPMSGTAKNNYAFLSLAFDGKEIIPELAEWTRTFPYDPVTAQPFDVEKLKNFQILPHNLDKETTWHKWGAETIKNLAEKEARRQLPDGEKIKDFRTSFSYDEKHDGRLFLVPFWFIYYDYEGQKHFVVYDGLGRNIHGTTPMDEQRYKSVQSKLKVAKGAWAIGLLVGVIFYTFSGIWGALISFVVSWIVVRAIAKRKASGILKAARAIRQAACDRIMKK